MIHTLKNFCVGSIFILYNSSYYLTRPYQNVIDLVILSKCDLFFLDAVVEGLRDVEHDTYYFQCLKSVSVFHRKSELRRKFAAVP